jgi:hypothetical protein
MAKGLDNSTETFRVMVKCDLMQKPREKSTDNYLRYADSVEGQETGAIAPVHENACKKYEGRGQSRP